MPARAPVSEPKRPSPRRKRGYSYSEDANESAATLDHEPADVERETPAAAEDNPSIERLEPHAPPPPPLFEEE